MPVQPQTTVEAAIALRDVIVMIAIDAYPSCENAFYYIVLPFGGRQRQMFELQAQI